MIFPFMAGCSIFGINSVEEAAYDVLRAENSYEIRRYRPLLMAQTYVDGDYGTAGKRAFRKLFNYISGENIDSSEISMTAPVIVDKINADKGKTLTITTPVLEERTDKGWRYMFVLPSSYNLESAPTPLDDSVKIVAEAPKQVASIRFSGLMSEKKLAQKTALLTQWIKKNGLKAVSDPRWAGYNPPWTIPLLRRNEVMIEVI